MSLYLKSMMYLVGATAIGFCLLNIVTPSESYKKQISEYNLNTNQVAMDVLRKSAESSEFLARQKPSSKQNQTKD